MTHLRTPKTKRGPKGPLLGVDREVGEDLDAQARRGDRGEDAEGQQVDGGDPVEILHKRHNTHLVFQFWGPRGSGVSVWDE